jgi:beta-phosphoglucomutase family hydrolase
MRYAQHEARPHPLAGWLGGTQHHESAGTVLADITSAADQEDAHHQSVAPGDAPEAAPSEAKQGPQPRDTMLVPVMPDSVAACLFDLDGVLTQTAKVHAAAWKEMFDAFLLDRSRQTGEPFRPFALPADYAAHVDGKLRLDGVRAFLASRGIDLPEGSTSDPPTALTVHGLGTRKNDLVLDLIRQRGVEVYAGSVRFVEATRTAGLRRAVVSASKNCREVLVAAGIEHLFEVRVDGVVADATGLRGKPAPDMFLAAADALGLAPARCAVFEDAIAGVEAGRAGAFGWVVGVDRVGQAAALRHHGADTVVTDLSELLEER